MDNVYLFLVMWNVVGAIIMFMVNTISAVLCVYYQGINIALAAMVVHALTVPILLGYSTVIAADVWGDDVKGVRWPKEMLWIIAVVNLSFFIGLIAIFNSVFVQM